MESGDVPHGERIAKIKRFCQIVAQKGYTWAWVDTCCIDKKSSAELSEAINSMHRWYHNAQECLVYLSDVQKGQSIRNSAWFTRGWTVQELLAPRDATFYDREWSQLGTRIELGRDISVASGIDMASLEEKHWSGRSVACKMSWFAHRRTSRIEDMAYSMLGIFDINMPLIYGEGWKSFKRLQIEIVNSTSDESIFAWDPWAGTERDESTLRPDYWRWSMLAPHPECFAGCGSINTYSSSRYARPPYAATNKSLQISLLSTDFDIKPKHMSRLTNSDAFLNPDFKGCPFSILQLSCGAEDDGPVFIVLINLPTRIGNSLSRYGPWVRFEFPPSKVPESSNSIYGKGQYETISVAII